MSTVTRIHVDEPRTVRVELTETEARYLTLLFGSLPQGEVEIDLYEKLVSIVGTPLSFSRHLFPRKDASLIRTKDRMLLTDSSNFSKPKKTPEERRCV